MSATPLSSGSWPRSPTPEAALALLRRLVLKRRVYGVDLSPMGAEIAKISLWLASVVPGSRSRTLDHNVKVGNSKKRSGCPLPPDTGKNRV